MIHLDNLIDTLIATQIMGWTRDVEDEGWEMKFGQATGFRYYDDWCPTGRIEDAYVMENKLAEDREVWLRYGEAFFDGRGNPVALVTADILHASPKERCVAALKALNIKIPEVAQ